MRELQHYLTHINTVARNVTGKMAYQLRTSLLPVLQEYVNVIMILTASSPDCFTNDIEHKLHIFFKFCVNIKIEHLINHTK
jgi:hypothetical protein